MKKLLIDIHPHFNFYDVLSSVKSTNNNSVKIEYIHCVSINRFK